MTPTPTTTSPEGPGTTPAPPGLATPSGTPKPVRTVAGSQKTPTAVQDTALAPVVPVVKELLTQLKQLAITLDKKFTASARQDFTKAIAIAEKLELALTLVDGVLTRKTLEKTLRAELDSTAAKIIEGVANESSSAAPATSYSTAAASEPRASELSVVVQLPASEVSTLQSLGRDALRERVELAMRTVQELSKVQPRVVRMTQKGHLQILARCVADAVLIRRHAVTTRAVLRFSPPL